MPNTGPNFPRRQFLGKILAMTNEVQLVDTVPSGVPAAGNGVVAVPMCRCFDGEVVRYQRPPILEVEAQFTGTALTSIDVTMARSRKPQTDAADEDADTWGEPENTQTFGPPSATPVAGIADVRKYASEDGPFVRFRTSNKQGGGATSDVILYVYAILDLRETIS